jgi:DnaJ-class molecular chaperone
MRTCTSYNGSGVTVRETFSYEGRSYPEKRSPCASCEGRGAFAEPCEAAIGQAIKGRHDQRSAAQIGAEIFARHRVGQRIKLSAR